MPDVPNRDEQERIFARKLAQLQRASLNTILEKLGDPPVFTRLTDADWLVIERELSNGMAAILTDVYLSQVEAMQEQTGISTSWDVVNQNAADWVAFQSAELFSKYTQNTIGGIRTAVQRYYEQGQTMGDLRDSLERWFSPKRAESVAVTEVTRASAKGEESFIRQINAENIGLSTIAVWQTNSDDKVCPICAPRDGKKRGDGWDELPPAHTRCRCWVNYRVKRNG